MPLYHFHLRTADGLERDDVGSEFAGIEAAYLQACETIPEMMAGLMEAGRDPLRCSFEIADADGRILIEVPFTERLTGQGRRPRPVPAPPHTSEERQAERLDSLATSVRQEAQRVRENLRRTREYVAQMRANRSRGF